MIRHAGGLCIVLPRLNHCDTQLYQSSKEHKLDMSSMTDTFGLQCCTGHVCAHVCRILQRPLPNAQVVLTATPGAGHSLGGALATLAAIDIRKELLVRQLGKTKVVCYTFAAPRTGNHAFAREYNNVVPDTWSVINDQVSCHEAFAYSSLATQAISSYGSDACTGYMSQYYHAVCKQVKVVHDTAVSSIGCGMLAFLPDFT